jgi:hypothetical protein
VPTSDALARLRAAAAAVTDLDGPADDVDHAPDGDHAPEEDGGFDAATHADRFSELHDALVTALADVDRG